MHRWIGMAVAVVVGVSGGSAAAESAAQRLMAQADALYDKRDQAGMADKSIDAYQQVLAVDDANAEAYWKIARVYYWKGTQEASDAAASKHYREGIEFAKLGIEADPKSAGAHFWLSVSYGKFGEANGMMQSLHLVEPMKAEIEKALALDEKFEWGGAYRVMCRLYMKLPGFKGGDIKKSIEFGKKSVALGPGLPMNHLYLAEALVQDGQKEEAKKVLRHIVTMPALPERVPESEADKELAKKLLAELGG